MVPSYIVRPIQMITPKERAKPRMTWMVCVFHSDCFIFIKYSEDRSTTNVDEGSSSGLAFLATSIRDLQSGSPTTSDPLDLSPTESKYSPWAVSDNVKSFNERCRGAPVQTHRMRGPAPAEIELLLKTYWTSIHPVRGISHKVLL